MIESSEGPYLPSLFHPPTTTTAAFLRPQTSLCLDVPCRRSLGSAGILPRAGERVSRELERRRAEGERGRDGTGGTTRFTSRLLSILLLGQPCISARFVFISLPSSIFQALLELTLLLSVPPRLLSLSPSLSQASNSRLHSSRSYHLPRYYSNSRTCCRRRV